MRTKIFLIIVLFQYSMNLSAQVGIGTKSPDPSAMLDVVSNAKGVLISRMTEKERNSIKFPAVGLLVYQIDNISGFYYFTGIEWKNIPSSSTSTTNTSLTSSSTGSIGTAAATTYVTSVSGTTNRITSSGGTAPKIDIATNYVGQTSITTLGTIATGSWNASIIPSTKGGAGSISGILKANGSGIVSSAVAGTDFLSPGTTTTSISEGTNLYFTDIRSRAALSLTTTGSSGAATYNNATGVLNIPQYSGGSGYTFSSPLSLSGSTVSLPASNSTTNGYLSSVDWSTFNNKLSTATAASTYAPLASPTFTGTVSGITKSMVGLGDVDNTSDANKPISTATQTALNGKVSGNAAIIGATKTKITYDNKGLVTSGADATTTDISEGDNKYFTEARVRSTLLTNLSTTTNSEVTASDNLLGAVGKLQAQISSKPSSSLVWSSTGNAGTDPANNFIGTTDARDLVFKVNNVQSGRLSMGGSTAYGHGAYNETATACCITAIGNNALRSVKGNGWNTAIGFRALENDDIGIESVAIGWHSLLNNKHSANTGLGSRTLESNINGGGNVAAGFSSLFSNTDGESNSAFGSSTLFFNTSGSNNVALGAGSMSNNTIGNQNIAIGYKAEMGSNDLTNAVAIGSRAQSACNNCLVLGSIAGVNGAPNSARVGIGTTSPEPSAAFEVKASSQGMLIPRMTKSQRESIQNPAEGLMLYQTDDAFGFWYYHDTHWINISTLEGANLGDMTYWDGNNWVKLPVGEEEQSLIICNGIPTWGGCLSTLNAVSVSNIKLNSADVSGSIIKTGGTSISEKGVVWSTSTNPTTSLSTKLSLGSGKGEFSGSLTNLEKNTTYYVRSYAINDAGIAYGEQITFQTLSIGIPEGLVVYYPFSGNTNDESGNNNHATGTNITLTQDRFGESNSAYKFNGNNNGAEGSVVISNSQVFNIGQAEYSIHLWFKPDNIIQNTRLLFNTVPHPGVAIGFNDNNAPSFVSYDMGNGTSWNYLYRHGSKNDYQAGIWYSATLVKSNNNYKFYINGVLEESFDNPYASGYNYDAKVSIATLYQNFAGDLDDFRLYNRVLTTAEITYLATH